MAAALYAAQSEQTFERTLNVSGPVHLEAMTDAGGISVTPGPAGSVHIRGILKPQRMSSFFGGGDPEANIRRLIEKPPIEQTGSSIRVGYVSDKSLLRGVSMRLEITAPAATDVRARADSGGIHIEGVNGPVDCQTDSGGIQISGIRSKVRAAADSGGVHIRNIKGSVYARADSGGIETLDVAGDIDAETDSGGIHMSQSTAAPVKARADSGGVTLKLASSGGYDIRASSDSGHVRTPEMAVSGTVSRNRAEGKVRGGGSLVDIKVDSGNVDIQ
jgi:hypothetical protein